MSEGLTDREIREIAAVENTIFVSTDEGLFRLNDEKWEHLLIDQPGKDGKTQAILDLAMDETPDLCCSRRGSDTSIGSRMIHSIR